MGVSPPSALSAPSALSGFDFVFSSLRLCGSAVNLSFRFGHGSALCVHKFVLRCRILGPTLR